MYHSSRMFWLFSTAIALLVLRFAAGLKVAIIGGGIGGTSSAYFLRKLAPPETEVEIHLFNHGEIGGRVATVQMQYDDKERAFEAGGAIIFVGDSYVQRWMDEFGLKKKDAPRHKGAKGIWDGKELVLVKSPTKKHFEHEDASDFGNIYRMLDQGQSFDAVDEMVTAMSAKFAKLLNKTTSDHFAESGYDPFTKEYAAAILNYFYGHSIEELPALVGSLSLAGYEAGFYSISGSNKQIVEKLIQYSKAHLIDAEVTKVSKPGDHFMLSGVDGQELGGGYDYVIVAVPLHQKQSLHIDGRVSPVDYKSDEHFPADPNGVWKIFSKEDVTDSQLKHFFTEIVDVKKATFLAYPDFTHPPSGRPKFRLSNNICFANAMEWFVNSIETSAIGGRHCVNMLLKDLKLSEAKKIANTEL